MSLTIMTFNLRYATAKDGDNAWPARREAEFQTIERSGAHIIGIQEGLYDQLVEIAEACPSYAWFGGGRRGDHADEHAAIFYAKRDVRLLEEGEFWLSETPDVPGSQSWGSSLPRMATYGRFQTGAGVFLVINTHFDHVSEEARLKASGLLLRRCEVLSRGTPFAVMGDFNDVEGSPPYGVLCGETAPLKDAWISAENREGPEGTFHRFTGNSKPTSRIDWILVRRDIQVIAARTVTVQVNGKYPSDHFPLLAELRLPPS